MKILIEKLDCNVYKINFFKKYLYKKLYNSSLNLSILRKENSNLITGKFRQCNIMTLKWFIGFICSKLFLISKKGNEIFLKIKKISEIIDFNLKFSSNVFLETKKLKSLNKESTFNYNQGIKKQKIFTINKYLYSKHKILDISSQEFQFFEKKLKLDDENNLLFCINKRFFDLKKINKNSIKNFLIVRNLKNIYSKLKRNIKSKL